MSEYGWCEKVAGTGVSRYVWKEKLAGIWSVDLWLSYRVSEQNTGQREGGRNSGVGNECSAS